MVVDSSALVAVLLDEPDASAFVDAMLDDREGLWLSAVNQFEASVVMARYVGPGGSRLLDHLTERLRIEIAPFGKEQAKIARSAHLRYGKGRHPAKLNLGDCCAYSLAKWLGMALLYKGIDFDQTDVMRVRTARS